MFLCLFVNAVAAQVELGIDRFFQEDIYKNYAGKRIGLITNHTGLDGKFCSSFKKFKEHKELKLVALFCPEHGLSGSAYAEEHIRENKIKGIPIYSLHGDTRRPNDQMLKDIDILIFDIQEIGCRSYTYASTLFYVMEEAAKRSILVIVLDRPNPMGDVVDGPVLKEKWRSFVGYIDVPYCHGMSIGELALYFNKEYEVKCPLKVIPMRGYNRKMAFKDTGLKWIPTSPYIPEWDTPLYYATTGILGAFKLVNIGVGYTLPFKLVGAPWIDGEKLAQKLNDQKLPGVVFIPFHFRPFYGRYKAEDCQGVHILIIQSSVYQPVTVQYLLIGILKSLYPKRFQEALKGLTPQEKQSFCKISGDDTILDILTNEKFVAWKLIKYQREQRKQFLDKRKKYLLYS